MPRASIEVIRETAATTAAVVLPTQSGIVVGPAYHIQDYPADKTSNVLGTFGSLTAASDGSTNNRPLPGAAVIDGVEPPGNYTGAVLDAASVVVYLDTANVELKTGTDGNRGTAAPNENLFSTTDANVDFEALGVRPGDRLVITDTSLSGGTVIKIIQEVGGYNGSTLLSNQLRTYTNIVESTLTGAENGSYAYRIEKVLTGIELPSSAFEVSGNGITVRGGLTISYDVDEDNALETVPVNYATVYAQYRALRQDLAVITEINSLAAIEETLGRIDERNPLAAALAVAFANTATPMFFFGVTEDSAAGHQAAIDAIENRDDVYAIAPLTNSPTILALYRASIVALAAASISQFKIVFATPEELPSSSVVSPTSSSGLGEFVSGDGNIVFAAAAGTFVEGGVAAGDVLHIVDNGVSDDSYTVLRVIDENRLVLTTSNTDGPAVLSHHFYVARPASGTQPEGSALRDHGSVVLNAAQVSVTDENVLDASRVGQFLYLDDGADGAYVGNYLITGVTDGTLSTADIGDDLTITARAFGPLGDDITLNTVNPGGAGALSVALVDTTITVTLEHDGADVVSTVNEVIAALTANAAINGLIAATVQGGGDGANVLDGALTGTTAGGAYATYTVVGGVTLGASSDYTARLRQTQFSVASATNYTVRPPYRRLLDTTAEFITGSTPVIVGDSVQQPTPVGAANSDYTAGLDTQPILTVDSDNRVTLQAGYEVEVSNVLATTTSQTVPHYRVGRALDKTGQVAELSAVPPAFDLDSYFLLWPDEAKMSEVTNTLTGTSNFLPSYFVAAALAGMVAATPPQQGFTRRAVQGFSGLRNSNTYFNRAQLDAVLDAGYFVIEQSAPSALPRVLGQNSTNVDTLETKELSMVRAYHFTAKSFKDTLDSVLGEYNVIDSTLAVIKNRMEAVGSTLTSNNLPRIGATMISCTVNDPVILDGTRDRVEVLVDAVFPAPLNRITLRIRG